MARKRPAGGKIGWGMWPVGRPECTDAAKDVDGIAPEDIAWVGEEFLTGDADRERDEKFDSIEREIFNPRYAFEMILTEVIRHHPVQNQKCSDEARLDTALTALLGPVKQTAQEGGEGDRSCKGQGGRKELADKKLLQIVAREFLRDVYGFSEKRRTITELCRVAIYEAIPNWQSMSPQQIDTIRSRLFRKFKDRAARDRVMIEYTNSTDYDARRYTNLADRILFYLSALKVVAPRSSLVDKTER